VNKIVENMMTGYSQFENMFKAVAMQIRDRLGDADLSNVKISIVASGRTHGDLEIEYVIGDYYSGQVVANTLEASVNEFLRRKGWDDINKPIAIPYIE
jgi:hypothetical protein